MLSIFHLASCCISSHLPVPLPLIKPPPSVVAPLPLSRHPPLLSSFRLFSRIRLLLRPSNISGCCVASRLPALPLIKSLLFGWLSHRLPSAGASASHRATASHQATTSPVAVPCLASGLPALALFEPLLFGCVVWLCCGYVVVVFCV